ncbi:MAG: radical SAM protein [Candidatus Eremiobacterota bacterium]
MKLLLVDVHKGVEVWNSLGAGYLSSYLTARGHEVDIEVLHFGTDLDDFINMLKGRNYPLIGFSASYYVVLDLTLGIIKKIKDEGIKSHIIMGGHTPTSCFDLIMDIFPYVDTISLGESEETLLEFIEKFYEPEKWGEINGLAFRREGKIIENSPRPLLADLNSVPYPHRKQFITGDLPSPPSALKDTMDYVLKRRMMVTSSRGCYGRCSFCSVYHFYNLNVRRGRTADNVVSEIEELVKKYDVKVIAFNDDNFFIPGDKEKKWYYDFADELERRNIHIIFNFQCRPNDVDYDLFMRLKEVGLHNVFVGTESFILRTLRLFRKGVTPQDNLKAIETLSKVDLDYQVGMIIFEPFTTFDEVKESMSIISSLYDKYGYSSPLWIDRLRVYHGTKIQKMLENKGRLHGVFPYYSYSIEDEKAEILSRILINGVSSFTTTEQDSMLAPQAGNLNFLWGMSYLKDLPDTGHIKYLPQEVVKTLSVETGKFFLNLIYEVISHIENLSTVSDSEIDNMTAMVKEKYGKENDRIMNIILKELITA